MQRGRLIITFWLVAIFSRSWWSDNNVQDKHYFVQVYLYCTVRNKINIHLILLTTLIYCDNLQWHFVMPPNVLNLVFTFSSCSDVLGTFKNVTYTDHKNIYNRLNIYFSSFDLDMTLTLSTFWPWPSDDLDHLGKFQWNKSILKQIL